MVLDGLFVRVFNEDFETQKDIWQTFRILHRVLIYDKTKPVTIIKKLKPKM